MEKSTSTFTSYFDECNLQAYEHKYLVSYLVIPFREYITAHLHAGTVT